MAYNETCKECGSTGNEYLVDDYYCMSCAGNKIDKLEAANKLYHKSISKASADFLGQKRVIDGFWEALHNSYNVESREEIEADTKVTWAEKTSPLAVALHFVWKREPKVKEMVKVIEGILRNYRNSEDMVGAIFNAKELLKKYK